MRQSTKQKILKEMYKTLAYSDVFDYPLTGKQLFSFLGIKITSKDFLEVAKDLPYLMYKNVIYYFLPRKKEVVIKRVAKKKISQEKMQRAKKIATLLSYLPTINYIGISGSLALFNADKKSDTDFFIITTAGTVWFTRLCVYLLLVFLGVKRHAKNSHNAICVNMFLSETDISFEKNIYVAHEIAQVMTLVNKNKTHEKLLAANKWIQNFFPNLIFPKGMYRKNKTTLSFFTPVEYFLRSLQLWYMKKKITREIVTPTRIAFHPIDYQRIILSAYNKKIQRYV